MRSIGKFFRNLRLSKGFSLREVGKLTNLSHVYIKKIEQDKSMPSFANVMKLLELYNVDINDFLKETGYVVVGKSSRRVSRIPLISWVVASNWLEVSSDLVCNVAEEWVEVKDYGLNVFALRVRGDSMEPEFTEGDIIVVNPNVIPEDKDFVVVRDERSKEVAFKQLRKFKDVVVLHPLNPKYSDIILDPDNEYKVIGKVVEKRKYY